jgi:hypothetical protein
MTDKPAPPSMQAALPSQTAPLLSLGPSVKGDSVPKVETGEEEPYTIKCICNFSDDDGNTIYCETCDTWQHIDCFYPDNRDEAIREDFAHSCAECKPRPLDRQKAIERTLRLKQIPLPEELADKKAKRPQSRSHKKKPKPSEVHVNGNNHNGSVENGKHGTSPTDPPPPSKKAKTSHRSSQSISSQAPKRSPSYNNTTTNTNNSNPSSRSNASHPLSPATTPPDLPDDFQIHHYSDGFYSLYNEHTVTERNENTFARLDVANMIGRWPRDPEAMKQEVGLTYSEVFQIRPTDMEDKKPRLKVQDAVRQIDDNKTLKWRFVKSTGSIEKDVPLIELNGAIGFQKDYCRDPANLWADLSSPLPFVFFHPALPLYIDTRREGSSARYIRRSCRPNAQLDTYLSEESNYHFWLVSDRYIPENEQITLPWDFRLEKSVCSRWLFLLGLSDDDSHRHEEIEMDELEYKSISNWIDRILSEYGGCACDLDNNCAFARFHRRYLHGRTQNRSEKSKKRQRKSRSQAISPTSTGHATNSRAASEGNGDDKGEAEAKYESASSRSKPPSRDPTPLRQGSFDHLGILTEPTDRDKRKVAMVEDSFRRMEQQQQPPRKKKRVSDGGCSTSSTKSKPRPAASNGQYVDQGTSRDMSGSPATVQSPILPEQAKLPSDTTRARSASKPRQPSTASRPTYVDASVQTDPTEGEWYSDLSGTPTRPKKRIISLSQRLMSNRQKMRAVTASKSPSVPNSVPHSASVELGSPSAEQKPVIPRDVGEVLSPTSPAIEDVPMSDAASARSNSNASESTAPVKMKTPDLRVQMPPVPAFDSNTMPLPSATTPLSASSSMVQSPFAMNGLPSPFTPTSVNGVASHPSPAKKKLSLSDYTKSRMNKAGSKASVGGTTSLKPVLSSPEESKAEVLLEAQALEKTEESAPAPVSTTAPKTNGL